MITFQIAWWYIPLAITVLCVIWTVKSSLSRELLSGIGEFIISLIICLAAWLIAILLKGGE